MMKARVLALSLSVLPLAATFTVPAAQAEELMKWERIPLQIPLAVGKERVLFADKNVRVGFPPALNGKLRVQSSGGAVYLKADAAFPPTRLQLQDVENGEVILLDVTASDKGSAEPVRIVYSGDVSSISSSNDTATSSAGSPSAAPGAEDGTQAKRKKVRYNAPLPVVLTRYAAQSLYGPVRTVEAVPGIHPVNPHLPKRITTLYPSEPVAITPLGGWGIGSRNVVALKVQNTARIRGYCRGSLSRQRSSTVTWGRWEPRKTPPRCTWSRPVARTGRLSRSRRGFAKR
jgi:integrating conjugative element protein (TIGR03749 family)